MNPGPLVLLPSDLDASLTLLDDREFARLVAAVTREEARRQGNKPEQSFQELEAKAPTARKSKRASETITKRASFVQL